MILDLEMKPAHDLYFANAIAHIMYIPPATAVLEPAATNRVRHEDPKLLVCHCHLTLLKIGFLRKTRTRYGNSGGSAGRSDLPVTEV